MLKLLYCFRRILKDPNLNQVQNKPCKGGRLELKERSQLQCNGVRVPQGDSSVTIFLEPLFKDSFKQWWNYCTKLCI